MSALSPLVDASSEQIRILHVDDEPDLADLTATFLEREEERFAVETATDASEGLDLLAERAFDCVVSDYDMPGTNGIEFLEAVRENHPDLPFILFTGKGSEEVASEAISAGVTDYLQKETGTDQYTVLANRVSNAIEHHRSRQIVEQSERRLREIIDAVPHLLYVVDEGGTYRLANEALAAFHGTTVDDIEGAQVSEVLGERATEQFMHDLADVLRSGTPTRAPPMEIEDAEGETHLLDPRLLPYSLDGTDDKAALGIAIDVTEHQRRETELERTRERMNLALEHTGSVVFEIGLESGETITHGAQERFYSGSPESTPTWREYLEREVHPEDRERFREFFEALTEGDRTEGVLEYRTDPDGGSVRWVRSTVSVERDGDGGGQVVGIARDVTAQKERELELRRTERRFQAVFNDPNILVGLLDTDGTVLDINRTAMEYVDATTEDIAGEPFPETPWFDHSDAARRQVREWIDRAASGEYVDFEADLRTADGEPYTVEGVFRPVRDDDGEVVSLLISDRDVTDRKERERELERYEAYLEESSDIVTVLDDSGTIKYESPSVSRILGHEQGELIGENGFEYIHPDDRDAVYAKFTELVAEPDTTVTVECRFRTADDDWRWLEVRGTNQLDHDAIEGVVTNNRDITERKGHEQELQRTTTVLSTLFETLPVGVLAEDESRNVLAVNRRMVELFGLSGDPEELVGADCERMAAEVSGMFVDPEGFLAGIDDLITDPVSTDEEEFRLADGRVFVRSHDPIELPDGAGHLWVYRDVTDRMGRERELERARDILEQTERIADVGGWEIDTDTMEVFWTEPLFDLLGVDREEEPPLDEALDVYHEEDRPTVEHAVEEALESGEPFDIEVRYLRGDEVRWLRVQGTPTVENGEVVSLRGTVQDITRQREREDRLRETTSRLEALYDESPDMIDVLDPEGRIQDVNRRFCEELGCEEEELLGTPIWEIDRSVDEADVKGLLDEFSVDERRKLEGEYERRDGSTFPVEVHLLRLNLEGDDRFLAISRDITERKERERRLQQQNEQLEQFASVVSHDLRNPLNVAQGRLELLTEDCDSEHIPAIERSHDRMDALIDDLLTLAREGGTTTDLETVSLAGLVRESWRNVETVDATLDVETDGLLRADEGRLRRLFENLIRNAVEHGSTSHADAGASADAVEHGGESVTVTVGELPGGFYVADDGPGIPEEDRGDVFDAGVSTSETGTGFGLSIVRQAAEAHGWTVSATESETGGARFEITGVEFVESE